MRIPKKKKIYEFLNFFCLRSISEVLIIDLFLNCNLESFFFLIIWEKPQLQEFSIVGLYARIFDR